MNLLKQRVFMFLRGFAVWFILNYLKFWAKLALFLHKPYIIGIAGSAGKSSARNALLAVLRDYKRVKAVTGNSETGVPLGLLGIDLTGYSPADWKDALLKAPKGINTLKNIDYLIVEMGIDDPNPPKNMDYLLSIIKPNLSISLNVAGPHLQQFEKTLLKASKVIQKNPEKRMDFILKKMAEEDTKIITKSGCKVGIYNNDNEYVKNAIEKKKLFATKLLTFGKNKKNDISYINYDITTRRTKLSYYVNNKEFELIFRKFILPPAYMETFASVILACLNLNLSLSQIKSSLETNFSLPKGRASVFEGYKNSTLIDSTYNAPTSAVLSFLDMLMLLKQKTSKTTVAVLGDMRELGDQAKIEHERVGKRLLKTVDYVYLVGPLTKEFILPVLKKAVGKKGATVKKVEWYKNAVQLGLHLKEEVESDSIILFKGSQNTIYLEEAVKFLLLNPQDIKKLTRQEEYWIKTKQDFFNI
jgi:UDP-N-acetylmuramoyl-tripeptide--D-alanyl-D-alanine ligase